MGTLQWQVEGLCTLDSTHLGARLRHCLSSRSMDCLDSLPCMKADWT